MQTARKREHAHPLLTSSFQTFPFFKFVGIANHYE